MAVDTSADLLAALEGVMGGCVSNIHVGARGTTDCRMCKQARAAIDAHKKAHRDRDDDACRCYAQGWQDGHEAERRH